MLIKTLIALFIISEAYSLSYEHIWHEHAYVHLLTVDPKEHIIVPVRASSHTGRETVQSLAERHGAIAAINGGFWKENGNPAGILKIDGVLLTAPHKPRGAIGWGMQGKKVCMDRVLTNRSGQVLPMSDPPDTTAEDWEACEHIVGGAPLLIQKKHILNDYHFEQILPSFLAYRHARTAIGILETGEWVFVIVDAWPLGGKTIPELALFLQELGCIQAINLDGGSSSTLVIEGNVINTPKYVYALAVSDAILIF